MSKKMDLEVVVAVGVIVLAVVLVLSGLALEMFNKYSEVQIQQLQTEGIEVGFNLVRGGKNV